LLAHESLCARGQARLEAELAELGADAEAVAAQSEDLMQERDALAAALAAAQAAAPGAPAQDCARALAVPAADAAAAATVERAAIARALAGAGASPEADADDAAGPGAASLDEVLARATALVRRSEAAEAAAAAAAELRGALAAAEQRAAALQDKARPRRCAAGVGAGGGVASDCIAMRGRWDAATMAVRAAAAALHMIRLGACWKPRVTGSRRALRAWQLRACTCPAPPHRASLAPRRAGGGRRRGRGA